MEFSFVHVLDFFFKVHKVFNLKYNSKLKSVMCFFEYYVYKQSSARRSVPQKYLQLGREVADLIAQAAADVDADKTADHSVNGA